jgi:hypothetical protein
LVSYIGPNWKYEERNPERQHLSGTKVRSER